MEQNSQSLRCSGIKLRAPLKTSDYTYTVALAGADGCDHGLGDALLLGVHLRDVGEHVLLADGFGFGAGVVLQILGEGGERVGLAVVLDRAGLGHVHEVGAGAAEAVAGGAEGGREAHLGDLADDLVDGRVSPTANWLLLKSPCGELVAAGIGAAAGGGLRDADLEALVAHLGGLAGGHDDSGVRNRQAQDGDELEEVGVGDLPRRGGGEVGAGGGLQAGNADGVRAAAEALLQMMDVLQHGQHLEAPVVDAEERADAHVVDAGLHGAVHHGGAPVVVGLLPRRWTLA